MPVAAQRLWSYKTGDIARCVAITGDGQHVAAGSKDGYVYFFGRDGQLLWSGNVENDAFRLALAENHQRLLVGCLGGRVNRAYLWDYEGHLVHIFDVDGPVSGLGITPNADFIALGTFKRDAGTLYTFDGEGNPLWQQRLGGAIRQLSLSPDGQYITVGADDQCVYLFDHTGKECWRYKTGAMVFAGSRLDTKAARIVAGSNDYHVYLFDHFGHPIWQHNTQSNINVVTITPDGRYIAAAGNAHKIFVFNNGGELIWSYQTNADIYGLGLSLDGQFAIAGTEDYYVYLFDNAGNVIWREKTENSVRSVAITPNGRLFAAVSLDRSVYVYENMSASDDFSDRWLSRNIIRRIRHTYVDNPYQGIAGWFDEFDRTLRQREFAVCERLLQEIGEKGYRLNEKERNYIKSREAALLLCQGISCHQRQEYEQARQYYERSIDIQRILNHKAGQEQVETALDELEKEAKGDPAILRLLLRTPHIIGDGGVALADGIADLTPVEQVQVIKAAKAEGYISPLSKALASSDTFDAFAQANAASALVWLRPGADLDTLVVMLDSENWVVRWQAILMLQQRFNEKHSQFIPHRDRVRRIIAAALPGSNNGASSETEPVVCRALAVLLGTIGEASDTLPLIELLKDKDADVRFAAIDALGKIGDRRALESLQTVVDGRILSGPSIKEKAAGVIEHIEERYPIFGVKKIALCRELTAKQQPVRPGAIFLPNMTTMYCVVTVSLAEPGTRVSCTWSNNGRAVSSPEHKVIGERRDTGTLPLVELIDTTEPEQTSDQSNSSNVVFSWVPSKGRWVSGNYAVHIALNSEMRYEKLFTVIDKIEISEAHTCVDIDGNGINLVPLQAFPLRIPYIHCLVILKEAPVDIEIQGEVYNTTKNQRVDKPVKLKTPSEGRNVEVLFKFASDRWEVGHYNVTLTTPTGSRSRHSFEIISI